MLVSTRRSTRLEKATLTIMAASSRPSRAGGRTITFDFNPKEYTVSRTANWARTDSQAAEAAGPLQWRGPGPRRIEGLTLFLDESASDTASVADTTEALLECCSPTPESLQADNPSGPFVLFGWGNRTSFSAVITSVSVTYTMFRPNGEPYRASVTLSLEEVDVATPRQNPTSGGLAARRTHTVVEGESLALIAAREYRRPSEWRILAAANGIDDPMRLQSGRTLMIPPQRAGGEGS